MTFDGRSLGGRAIFTQMLFSPGIIGNIDQMDDRFAFIT
jgi:hypothetical protein